MGEENLGISSDRQKGKVHSPIHCLNHGASNIILDGGTTYLSDLEHLENGFLIKAFAYYLRCGAKGLQGKKTRRTINLCHQFFNDLSSSYWAEYKVSLLNCYIIMNTVFIFSLIGTQNKSNDF